MNDKRFSQISGWALLLGGIMGIVTHVLHPAEPKSAEQIRMYVQHTPAAHVGVWFGMLLVLLGLPQLFARLSRSAGVLTLIAFPLIFVGIALADGMHCPLEFGALPAIYQVAPDQVGRIYLGFSQTYYGWLSVIGAPVLMLGLLLFVVDQRRSRELASWPGWLLGGSLLAMGGAIFNVPGTGLAFAVLLYAAFGAYGALLLRATSPLQAKKEHAEKQIDESS